MKNTQLKIKLVLMLVLQYAAWGAYLTSLGRYLGNSGLGPQIKWFFAMQGIVSIFMPTLMGIVADRPVALPRPGRPVHARSRFLLYECGWRRAVRTPIHTI